MIRQKPSFDLAVQYFQTIPLSGIAYAFAQDGFGVGLAVSAGVHRGLRVAGIVAPDGMGTLNTGSLPRIFCKDLADTPYDYILVGHPERESEQLLALAEAGVPKNKIISAYSDEKFAHWVSAREVYKQHGKVSHEFEDILSYQGEGAFMEIAAKCSPYTVTSLERMFSLYKSVEYVVKNDISGSFVECGVWNGGSTMVAALSFMSFGVRDRDLYLFDTFAGMTKPDANDTDLYGSQAMPQWESDSREGHNEWCYGSLETVRANMKGTGYPEDRIHYVVGDVAKTLPCHEPDRISILRLDTDWYASTLVELQCLFPKVVRNGILIIDDYGHWCGAKQAVDEYFEKIEHPLLLTRIDYTGRLAVKTF